MSKNALHFVIVLFVATGFCTSASALGTGTCFDDGGADLGSPADCVCGGQYSLDGLVQGYTCNDYCEYLPAGHWSEALCDGSFFPLENSNSVDYLEYKFHGPFHYNGVRPIRVTLEDLSPPGGAFPWVFIARDYQLTNPYMIGTIDGAFQDASIDHGIMGMWTIGVIGWGGTGNSSYKLTVCYDDDWDGVCDQPTTCQSGNGTGTAVAFDCTCPHDLNGDGTVNCGDELLAKAQRDAGCTIGSTNTNWKSYDGFCSADFDRNGVVTLADVHAVTANAGACTTLSDLASPTTGTTAEKNAWSSFKSYQSGLSNNMSGTGFVTGVVLGGELWAAYGSGYKNQKTSSGTYDGCSLYRAASTSKMMAGIVATKMKQDGKLDFNAPIRDFLGTEGSWADVYDLSYNDPLTLHRVLNQTSGFLYVNAQGLGFTADFVEWPASSGNYSRHGLAAPMGYNISGPDGPRKFMELFAGKTPYQSASGTLNVHSPLTYGWNWRIYSNNGGGKGLRWRDESTGAFLYLSDYRKEQYLSYVGEYGDYGTDPYSSSTRLGYRYSDANATMSQIIIENEYTSDPNEYKGRYAEIAAREIFAKAGMYNTGYEGDIMVGQFPSDISVGELAGPYMSDNYFYTDDIVPGIDDWTGCAGPPDTPGTCYYRLKDKWEELDEFISPSGYAKGGLITNAVDMTRLLSTLMKDRAGQNIILDQQHTQWREGDGVPTGSDPHPCWEGALAGATGGNQCGGSTDDEFIYGWNTYRLTLHTTGNVPTGKIAYSHHGGHYGYLHTTYWVPECNIGAVVSMNSVAHPPSGSYAETMNTIQGSRNTPPDYLAVKIINDLINADPAMCN